MQQVVSHNITSYESSIFIKEAEERFIKNRNVLSDGEYCYEISDTCFLPDCTTLEVISFLKELLMPDFIETHDRSMFCFYNKDTFTIVTLNVSSETFKKRDREFSVIVKSNIKHLFSIKEKLDKISSDLSNISIDWFFNTKTGLDHTSFWINTKTDGFHKEFYPYIDDIDKYIDNFDSSDKNILILLGPPGTGKTSFIRYLLKRNRSHCFTTYDEDVMSSDSLYINFLKSSSVRYMILEDSDLLLTTREKHDNRVMSKILNASDGLIPISKKFIFTANITNESKIDEALIRPGRCFDVKHFRNLSRAEALVAANKLNKNLTEKDEYSLAEVFNGTSKPNKNRMGFGIAA